MTEHATAQTESIEKRLRSLRKDVTENALRIEREESLRHQAERRIEVLEAERSILEGMLGVDRIRLKELEERIKVLEAYVLGPEEEREEVSVILCARVKTAELYLHEIRMRVQALEEAVSHVKSLEDDRK